MLFRSLLPDAFYLFVIRDFQSVVYSLIKRDFAELDKKYLSRKYFSRLIWTYFRRPIRLQRFYQKNVERYLKVWIVYNQEILKNINTLNRDSYLVVDYASLQKHDQEVFTYIKDQWKFNLNFHPFKEVYKESLMSREINLDQYIKDKTLLHQALELEKKLKAFLNQKTLPDHL